MRAGVLLGSVGVDCWLAAASALEPTASRRGVAIRRVAVGEALRGGSTPVLNAQARRIVPTAYPERYRSIGRSPAEERT